MAYRVFTSDSRDQLNTFVEMDKLMVPYKTATQMETQAFTHPESIKEILEGYEKDPHFSEVLKASGTTDLRFSQYTVREDGIILFDNSSGYSRICLPRSMIPQTLKDFSGQYHWHHSHWL